MRDDVGEGVRGSRDNRFNRSSSSYGTSRITKVGVLDFVASTSWVILDRHELPEPQMYTGERVSDGTFSFIELSYLH